METNDKQLALAEIYYELLMLNSTERQLAKLHFYGKENSDLTLKRRIYTESFLIHARNLIDFFEDWKNDKDIRCSDFNISKASVKLPDNNTKSEINKYLSHLTKERIKKQSPLWEITKIKEELHKYFKYFLSGLPEDSFPKNDFGSKKSFESLLSKPTRMPQIASWQND
ncbi:MAG: hypothetical protein A3B30_01020 [Candidatus Komeilibacteria bacterium RIFCSPLOWO2_01_FULL_52_15]|uniref:Uncharacterized protein n=2 Tax=Candidatus Komeiliibacteriota TaxID=1817908 RepID=A0A1G2BTU8_9BACT|nr:MAG: hypothetical protein A2677_02725 [Candidatus Komeilibacteria bacterium RIFCSPHIGHO2_01_FULL_52_14]OGY91999.1 MAG: hypothetical protein A3B30_01020 [Candidatus Komeilibacteria bacterium RIFCSPLOWO2_01_FULL_52_15]